MFDKINFPLVLVLATGISGLIWLIDVLFFASRRRTRSDGQAEQPVLVEYAASFFPVLFVVLFLRSFLFEPFRIPSGSMIPTLLVGDFILVSKFSYGVRLPVLNRKIIDTGEPERGDVAVFRFPADPSVDYIKRVVGLPGDVVEYTTDKQIIVNGEPFPISGAEPYVSPSTDAVVSGHIRRTEKLGDATHDILVRSTGGSRNQVFEVPEGHYFMMGDNRDNSNDGRMWGFVPEENLVGKAKYIWMHWQGGILWSRLGDKIQ